VRLLIVLCNVMNLRPAEPNSKSFKQIASLAWWAVIKAQGINTIDREGVHPNSAYAFVSAELKRYKVMKMPWDQPTVIFLSFQWRTQPLYVSDSFSVFFFRFENSTRALLFFPRSLA